MQKTLEQIAARHLDIDTLAIRKSDRLDFHEVSVWGLKAALEAAYEAGRNAATSPSAPDALGEGPSGIERERIDETLRE